jgi:peroxiredoxin
LSNGSWSKYIIITIITISALSIGYTYLYNAQGASLEVGTDIGKLAPDFSLKNLEGETFSLSSYRGKVVIIDFMSTTCFWCLVEMPDLVDFYGEYGEEDLEILSLDIWPETEDQLRKFKQDWEAEWVFAAFADEVGLEYKVTGIPAKYMLDKKGVIVWKQRGSTKFSTLAEEVDKLI